MGPHCYKFRQGPRVGRIKYGPEGFRALDPYEAILCIDGDYPEIPGLVLIAEWAVSSCSECWGQFGKPPASGLAIIDARGVHTPFNADALRTDLAQRGLSAQISDGVATRISSWTSKVSRGALPQALFDTAVQHEIASQLGFEPVAFATQAVSEGGDAMNDP